MCEAVMLRKISCRQTHKRCAASCPSSTSWKAPINANVSASRDSDSSIGDQKSLSIAKNHLKTSLDVFKGWGLWFTTRRVLVRIHTRTFARTWPKLRNNSLEYLFRPQWKQCVVLLCRNVASLTGFLAAGLRAGAAATECSRSNELHSGPRQAWLL